MMGNRAESMEGRSTKQRLTIVLILSASYLIAEVIGGVVTGSLSRLAGAGHIGTSTIFTWGVSLPATTR